MDELTKLIVEELGQKVLLHMPDVYKHGLGVSISPDLSEQKAKAQVEKLEKIVSLEKFLEIKKITEAIQNQRRNYTQTNNTLLAARVVEHDLISKEIGFESCWLQFLEKKDLWNGLTGRAEYANVIIPILINYKSFLTSMAYLASGGDNQFLFEIPISDIKHLASVNFDDNKQVIERTSRAPKKITNLELVTCYQCMKNAKTFSREIKIKFDSNEDYNLISVADNGYGLVYRDSERRGKPIPIELIPRIFEDFTTKKEGGLGLELSKEILALMGGGIEVITTREEGPTIRYSTLDYLPPDEITKRSETGTEFILKSPKYSLLERFMQRATNVLHNYFRT